MRAPLILLMTVGWAGCVTPKPLVATAFQPHPRTLRPNLDRPNSSHELFIYTGSRRSVIRVRNSAQFVAVTRDLVRFHLGVFGPTDRYTVWLEDDAGRRHDPIEREVAITERLMIPWWNLRERICRGYRRCSRVMGTDTLNQVDIPYGQADYVFRAPDLIGPHRQSLTLHVEAPHGRELRYTWTFVDGTDIRHGYLKRSDIEDGFVSIPGPGTVRLGSRLEDATVKYIER